MKSRAILAVIFAGLLVTAACSSTYETDRMDYNTWDVRPTWTRIDVQKIPGDVNTAECAFGVGAGGVGAVAAVVGSGGSAVPVGFAAWFVWGVGPVTSGLGLGQVLGDCWNQYNSEVTVFNVYTQCPVNHPVLQSSFTDYGSATAFVNLQSCRCSLACLMGFEDAPGMWDSGFIIGQTKHYWHDGPNRLNGPAIEPTPIDYNALADSMGLPYAGCNLVSVHPDC